ncbi:MAG: YjfB family protein [Defluviitaleaceae bacterium]|nr:YjfB family protein [Defluviitaleaceae bacterium]
MEATAIAALATSMSQQNLMQEVNVKLMRNAMEHAEATGQLAQDLLSAIPLPVPPVGFDGVGANIDVYI